MFRTLKGTRPGLSAKILSAANLTFIEKPDLICRGIRLVFSHPTSIEIRLNYVFIKDGESLRHVIDY